LRKGQHTCQRLVDGFGGRESLLDFGLSHPTLSRSLHLGINRPEVANDCIKNKQIDGEFTGSWTLMWLR
jgi:hypothetical protein